MTGGHSYLGCALGKVYRPLGVSKICHSGQRLEVYHSVSPSASWMQSTAFCENTLILADTKKQRRTHPPKPRQVFLQKKITFKKYWQNNHELRDRCSYAFERKTYMDVSKNSGFSPQIIHSNRVFYYNHPFWGTPIFGNTHMGKHLDFE